MEAIIMTLDDFVASEVNRLMSSDVVLLIVSDDDKVPDERIIITEDNNDEMIKKYGQYKINEIRPTFINTKVDTEGDLIGNCSIECNFGMLIELECFVQEPVEEVKGE